MEATSFQSLLRQCGKLNECCLSVSLALMEYCSHCGVQHECVSRVNINIKTVHMQGIIWIVGYISCFHSRLKRVNLCRGCSHSTQHFSKSPLRRMITLNLIFMPIMNWICKTEQNYNLQWRIAMIDDQSPTARIRCPPHVTSLDTPSICCKHSWISNILDPTMLASSMMTNARFGSLVHSVKFIMAKWLETSVFASA